MRLVWAQLPKDSEIGKMFMSLANGKLVWCGCLGSNSVLCKYPDTQEHWTLTKQEFEEEYGELPDTKGEWYEYEEDET